MNSPRKNVKQPIKQILSTPPIMNWALIISAPAEESTQKYYQYARLIPQLEENVHYDIDHQTRTCSLTEEGIAKLEQALGVDNLYTEVGIIEVHHIEQALKAQALFKKDIDY